jgi:hypothetical protein
MSRSYVIFNRKNTNRRITLFPYLAKYLQIMPIFLTKREDVLC